MMRFFGMLPALGRSVRNGNQQGQVVLEYMLVVAVIVLSLVASIYGDRANSLPRVWVGWYQELAGRVAKP